ncbi:MAG: tripartite tricarboxylate transporter substrate binding protein [Betaproteobacteria bacterium]|nr:tripartite tricarboxylate transporter substrate binding protein [Betaproteobacteria bacterium]
MTKRGEMAARGRALCARLALFCGAVSFLGVPAVAQEVFPSHPIQLIVPQPPGGVADLHARPFAMALERVLKQPVVVMNKPGAGSVMGTQFVANSRPDGYTLLIAMPGFFITPPVDILNGRPPKFRIEQFTPIARLSAEPLVMVVQPGRQWKSVADLIADAKRRPGAITFASSGLYTSLHLQMEFFAASAGINLRHVPYNGAGPAVIALLGGHVDALASGPGPVLKKIASGGLVALAMSGDKRLAELPEVPTLKELGLNVEYYQQVGIVARKEAPAQALAVLRDAAKRAVKDPDFATALTNLGTGVSYLDASEYQKQWARDTKSIAEVLQRIGKQID